MIAEIRDLINSYLSLTGCQLDIEQALSIFPTDVFCPLSLVERYLEEGGCLFGNPVFEDELFNIFDSWLCDGKEIKVWMYAHSLLEKLPESANPGFRQWLKEYVNGDRVFSQEYHNQETWPGQPETYLSNWNWSMHEFSQRLKIAA